MTRVGNVLDQVTAELNDERNAERGGNTLEPINVERHDSTLDAPDHQPTKAGASGDLQLRPPAPSSRFADLSADPRAALGNASVRLGGKPGTPDASHDPAMIRSGT